MTTELAGHAEGDRLSPAELRKLFLFEKLDAEQLDFLASHGSVEPITGGTYIYREGEPATCFYVLLSGTVALSRTVRGDEVETTRTDQVGAYAGATQAYIERIPQIYLNSMVADLRRGGLPAAGRRAGRARCATGSRWRCTCSRGCSSACARCRPWSASASGCWPSARCRPA